MIFFPFSFWVSSIRKGGWVRREANQNTRLASVVFKKRGGSTVGEGGLVLSLFDLGVVVWQLGARRWERRLAS